MTSSVQALASLLVLSLGGLAAAAGENIALGKSYVFQDAPRYAGCTDAGDAVQLSDGKHVAGPEIFWLQKEAVGWQDTMPVVITVDLGTVQPIAGAAYSTASDSDNNVAWPSAVFILSSDDQSVWRRVGDLVELALPDGKAPPRGAFRYATESLQARGRYVRFVVVPRTRYTFCDELEVYRGPESLLAGKPQGDIVTDLGRLGRLVATRAGLRNRLSADLKTVRAALAACPLAAAEKVVLGARLDALEKEASGVPDVDPETFRTVFPMNGAHAGILAVNSAILRARGVPLLAAAKLNRYDYFAPFDVPPTTAPELALDMMGGEFRADALTLANAGETPLPVRLRVQGLPGAPCPAWLTVSAMPWTDATGGVPVAAALPKAPTQEGAYGVTLPVGLQTRLWLGVDSASIPPGSYQGALLIEGGGSAIRVPFSLSVSKLRMGQPRLSLGMWDYTPDGRFGKNTEAAIAMMRSHFVDSPWATNGVLPWPTEADFDAAGALTKPLDTTKLDQWIALWPGARRYLVFANVQGWYAFAGAKLGTAEFDARVGSWARALAEHLRALKLSPGQLGLLLVDEPSTDDQDVQIVAWAKAIKAAAPDLTLFQDPVWARPDEVRNQEAITLADIICPEVPGYKRGGADVAQYYEKLRQAGKQLWFYQCNGPVKTFDPYRYQRLQAWHAFANGVTGEGFWSFFDAGGGQSCWNEYAAPGNCYTPVFLDPSGITDGIHWEAVREGIEDYEYLAMLRDAAERSQDATLKAEALDLLREAPGAVIGTYSETYLWDIPADRSAADTFRLKALRLLERLGE